MQLREKIKVNFVFFNSPMEIGHFRYERKRFFNTQMAFLMSVSVKYKVWVKIQGSSVIIKMEFHLVIK